MPVALLALAAAAFAIGTSEFVVMGLLPDMALDLGVTLSQAGLLVTGYAMGVVVGAPLFAVATARLPRKPTLVALASLFVLGNPLLQTLIVQQAHAAPNLASTLNQGAFNLGNAAGAWIGSAMLAAGAPLAGLPWAGAALTLLALLLAAWSSRLGKRGAGLQPA
jgi:DHA1 family inner membrane transport protein